MSGQWPDLRNDFVHKQVQKPLAITATTTTAGVDMVDTDGPACMAVSAGVVTDGGYTITVEESETSGGTYTALALNAVMPELITTNDDQIHLRTFVRSKRFVRAVITESTASVGMVIAITFIARRKSTP